MLSIQAVRGLPRLRAPGIVPFIISFSRQLHCFLVVTTVLIRIMTTIVRHAVSTPNSYTYESRAEECGPVGGANSCNDG